MTDSMLNRQQWAWQNRWWLVLAGGTVMGSALGIRHVQGLLMQPVVLDQGWSRASFAWAFALQNLMWGLAQPITGMIADRFGAARVLMTSTLLYAVGLLVMACAKNTAWLTWGDGILVGVALSGTAFSIVYGALSRLFAPSKWAWALGVAGAMGGLGQFLMVPFTQSLLNSLPWQQVVLAMALVMVLMAPLGRMLRDQPGANARTHAVTTEDAEQSLYGALRQAFTHRGFWLLNAGFLVCGFQLAFIGTHLPAYLLDQGIGARQAGMCLAIVALANVMGTYVCSWIGGRIRKKYVLSWLYVVRSVTMVWFVCSPVSVHSAYVFSFVMGLLWLGTVPLTNGIVTQVFGVRYVGTLFGFVFFGHQLGGFLGAWLGGVVYDSTHSYQWLWIAAISLGMLAAVLHWPINDERLEAANRPLVKGA